MPFNVKLTKDLTRRILPDCTPEKAVREYFHSVAAERDEKKKPEWDVARFSPATELIAKQREFDNVTERLNVKRQEHRENRKELDQRWNDLHEEENQLKLSFIKFNQFVKDNSEKRERAERKINEEKIIQAKKRSEIEMLRDQLHYLTKVKEKMHKHVQEYKIYEDFLEGVAASTADFQSIYDISTRYEILIDTRADLAAKQVKDLEEMEVLRNEMTHLDEEKEQMLMGINNEMAELLTKYDEAKQRSLHWETIVGRIKTVSLIKKREIAEVKTSCWNLYYQMKKARGGIAEKTPEDIEGQLVEVKEAIRVLQRVMTEVRKRATATGSQTSIVLPTSLQAADKDDPSKKVLTPEDVVAMEEEEERKRQKAKEAKKKELLKSQAAKMDKPLKSKVYK